MEAPKKPKKPVVDIEAISGIKTKSLSELGIETVKGRPVKSRTNLRLILEYLYPPDQLRYNQITGRVEFKGRPLDNNDITAIGQEIEGWNFDHNDQAILKMVEFVARSRSFNPIKDYLEGLKWDGVQRLQSALPTYWKTEDSPIVRKMGLCFFLSLVARAYQPGCKVDTAMIFLGNQGQYKSTAFKALMPDESLFSDSSIKFDDVKAAAEQIRGKWLVEIAEMASFERHEAEQIKAFLSSSTDRFRAPYAALAEDVPRVTVFYGTSNRLEVLRDPTGNRRFWPVQVPDDQVIDLTGLRADRDQLWAEAVAWYKAGESWWMGRDWEPFLNQHQERFELGDALDEMILKWIHNRRHHFTPTDLAYDLLGVKPAEFDRAKQTRIGNILQRILPRRGWRKARIRVKGAGSDDRVWAWCPPEKKIEGGDLQDDGGVL